MRYLFFDTSSGFSPLMALGALVDMCREKATVNEILKPFGASLFTQNVKRGYSEGLLAHIDINPSSACVCDVIENAVADDKIKKTAMEYVRISGESGHEAELRETLEAVCVCELCKELCADKILYSDFSKSATAGCTMDEFLFPEQKLSPEKETAVSPSGTALLKLMNACPGDAGTMNVMETGYGADVETNNPHGVLRALLCSDESFSLFTADVAYESVFWQETATF